MTDTLRVGAAQMAPVWLQREATLEKVVTFMERAAEQGCALVAFGEALVPGYPFWIPRTDGARFESPLQKELYALYVRESVDLEAGHLDGVCRAAARLGLAVYLGCIERGAGSRGQSVFASLVYIDATGAVRSVHRKLMPTYEERLAWSPGDGHGLRVHALPPFRVGGLNCWENWMPLARAALYGQGEDLHVAAWPGGAYLTRDITRFMAKEGRSFVISASGLMRREDFPADTPHLDLILAEGEAVLADGGSCVCGPDGEWLVEPVTGEEIVITADLDHARVREERQSFDPAGHYARPDVVRLTVDRTRQSTVDLLD